MDKELVGLLLQRLDEVADPDAYEALVSAALDETHGDLQQAIEIADKLSEEHSAGRHPPNGQSEEPSSSDQPAEFSKTDATTKLLAVLEALSRTDLSQEEREAVVDEIAGTEEYKLRFAGFTGEKPDKIGRRTCWNDGKRVKCQPKPKEKKPRGKAGPKKEAGPAHTAEDIHNEIKTLLQGKVTDQHVHDVAMKLSQLKQGDVNAIKKKLGIKVGGKKEAQAKHIAEQALASVREAPKTEEPKPAPKKEAPKPKKEDPHEAAKTSPRVDKADAKLKELQDAGRTSDADAAALAKTLEWANAFEVHEFKLRHGLIEQGDFQNEPVESVAKRALEQKDEKPAEQPPEKPAEKPAELQVNFDPTLTPRGQDAMVRATHAIRTAKDLTTEQQQEFFDSTQRVIKNMPPKAQERMAEINYNYFSDKNKLVDGIVAAFPERKQDKVRARFGKGTPGGLYSPAHDGVFVDGGREGKEAENAKKLGRAVQSHEIYAHEFGHGLDGPDFAHSKSDEWNDAWKEELSKNQLTKYAAGDTSEGLAEFSRLLYSGEHDLNEAKTKYKNCWAYFEKQGWTPEVKAKTQMAKATMLDEIFGEKVVLDDDGTHADVLVQ